MHIKAIQVTYKNEYLLEITFENGEKGTADFSEYAKRGGVFSQFRDIGYFRKVTIDSEWGVLCWPGDIDIAPETVYQLATGKTTDEVVTHKI
jgi:hypothetical protein